MRSRGFVALGLGLLLSWGCQYIAGLEERSELRATSVQGGEGGEGGDGGEAGQGGDGGTSAGAGGSFPGTGGGGQAGEAGEAGASGQGPALARPPPRVGDPSKKGGGVSRFFVVKKFDFGLRDSEGFLRPNDQMGKGLGFDLDGKCSVKSNKLSLGCTPEKNLFFSSLYDDGFYDDDLCRDNLFGGALFPAVAAIGKVNFDVNLNYNIVAQGDPTLLIEIEDLDDGLNDAYAPANLYLAAQILKEPPNWDDQNHTRIIDIDSAIVTKTDSGAPCEVPLGPNGVGYVPPGCEMKAVLRFEHGYVTNNVWVNGPFQPEEGEVQTAEGGLVLGGIKLKSKLQAVVITLEFANELHRTIKSGSYGAVLSKEELAKGLPVFLERLCVPADVGTTSIPDIVLSNADIMAELPFNSGSPDTNCSGLSLGMGLEVVPVKLAGADINVPLPGGGTDKQWRPFVGKSIELNPCGAGAGGAGGTGGAGGEAGQGGAGAAGSEAGSAGKGGG